MSDQPPRRHSDVLDSILDTVEGTQQQAGTASGLFRARALEQLDVAAEVDNQLPLVSRKSWLLAGGLALVIAGFLVWAALTPSITSLTATGRMVAPNGLIGVTTPVAGAMAPALVEPGEVVQAGQQVGSILREDGSAQSLYAAAPGTVWQVLVQSGATVTPGTSVMNVLPPGSDVSVLVPVPEGQGAGIQAGMDVNVGQGVEGTVVSVNGSLTAAETESRTGIANSTTSNYDIVTIKTLQPLPAGSLVPVRIILSEETVLSRAVGG